MRVRFEVVGVVVRGGVLKICGSSAVGEII